MYLIHSPDLDDAEDDGGHFEGMVAAIDTDAKLSHRVLLDFLSTTVDEESDEEYATYAGYCFAGLILMLVPLAIVGGFSGFRTSKSDASERGWMMSWLVIGSVSSIWVRIWTSPAVLTANGTWDTSNGVIITMLIITMLITPLFVPAVGGMVMVGRMLNKYGVCANVGP